MEWIKNNFWNFHFIAALAFVGVIFAAANINNQPLFQNTDNFVLFASEELKLEQGVQVSSGDLGSNSEIDIEKDAIINGNLFADEVIIDKNTTVNGNVSFNKSKTHKETKILGTQTKPVQLPIANLPDIPDFQVGTQDFKFEGQNNALAAGKYQNIILEKNSRLNLSGGVYNLHKLELKENSILIFNAPTTLNVQLKLKGQERIAILPGNNNLKPTDLAINYVGVRPKNEKVDKEDDDEEINALHNNQEKKDQKEGKIGRPIVFGKESFLNFKLLAPKATVHIGDTSTIRGQVLARKVKVEKESIVSRELTFNKESNPDKIVTTVEGEQFPVNEIILVFKEESTPLDVQNAINPINGRVTGFIPTPQIYKIEIPVQTPVELDAVITVISEQRNPLILFVTKNFSGGFK